ncbi:MAG TPA: aldolase/citrate lyase family protein [Micromonospora sp.]
MTLAPLPGRLRCGDPLIGTLVTLDSPETAEALAIAGAGWLFLDGEHSPMLDPGAVQRIAQTVHGRCYTVARVPANRAELIARTLDSGVNGVIVPHVRSAADAVEAVRAAKYPPLGRRGVGLARASGYGTDLAVHLAHGNCRTALILQIEDVEAVAELDRILAVPGVDGIFVGPYDLSASMGRLGDVHHPEVRLAVERVRAACRDASVPLGIFTGSAAAAKAEIDSGATLVAVGTDVAFLIEAARSTLAGLGGSAVTPAS